MNVIQSDQIDIAFITVSDMPMPDQETHLIVNAVEGMGVPEIDDLMKAVANI